MEESDCPSRVTPASTFKVPLAGMVRIPMFSGCVFQLEAGHHSDQYSATLRPEKEYLGQQLWHDGPLEQGTRDAGKETADHESFVDDFRDIRGHRPELAFLKIPHKPASPLPTPSQTMTAT